MAKKKTAQEIEVMREGGRILSQALGLAVSAVVPGVRIKEIDEVAHKALLAAKAEPSFKGYTTSLHVSPFPSAVCVSVNEEVVHGLGNRERKLQEGDLVGLDIGCWYKGMCTDMSVTVPVGKITREEEELLSVTREALMAGVQKARAGGDVRDISKAIEAYIAPHGYGIVRTLTGHGVGHAVHEEPHIPNFFHPNQPSIRLESGMCLAIEPMVALGDYLVETGPDGWAVVMKDGSRSAHFEVTIVVTENGPEILTPLHC